MLLPKYAKLEIERRFLVDVSKLPPLDHSQAQIINDLYLNDSRLRLREVIYNDCSEYKLCKKYGSADIGAEPISNLYLSAQEHENLATLPGSRIHKRRFHIVDNGVQFGIDLFEQALEGLVLAEVEAETIAEINAISVPVWAIREVTTDPFFTGGNLCHTSAAKLAVRLVEEGLRPETK